MKFNFYLLLFLISISVYAQEPLLFQHDWRLESITTDTETYTPSPNPNFLGFGTDFDYLVFNDNLNNYNFHFGMFGNVIGDNIIFNDANQSFDITNWILTMGESSGASLYFLYNFFLTEFNGAITNPFTYNFTTVGDITYLDITNSIGEVATFYAANLSQDEFLKESITIFPNPVSEVLNIKSSSIPIENLKVYDMNGRLVMEINSNIGEINVSVLQKGVYILNAETSFGVLRKKMIKE